MDGQQIKFTDLFEEEISSKVDSVASSVGGIGKAFDKLKKEHIERAKDLSDALKTLASTSEENIKEIEKLATEVERLCNSYGGIIKVTMEYEKYKKKEQEQESKDEKKKKKAAKRVQEVADAYAKLTDEERSYVDLAKSLVTTDKQREKIDDYTLKMAREKEGSFNRLSATYETLKQATNSMTEAELEEADGGKRLVDVEKEIYEKMKEYQAETGKMTLNVGNYTESIGKAMNGLNIAAQQVARELPSLANGINTFFIAISNNIPILIDAMDRYREALKKAQAEGKPMPSLAKSLMKGFLGWQTLLLIGLTVLAKYGKQILQLVFHFKTLEERVMENTRLQKIYIDLQKSAQEIINKRVDIADKAYEREISLMRAQGKSLDEIHRKEVEQMNFRKQSAEEDYELNKRDIANLDAYRGALQNLLDREAELKTAITKRGGEGTKRQKRTLKLYAEEIANMKEVISLLEETEDKFRNAQQQAKELAIQQYNEIWDREIQTRDLMRETKDVQISLIQERFQAEEASLTESLKREIENINSQLKKAYTDLSASERKSLDERKKLLQQKYDQEIAELNRNRANAIAESEAQLNEVRLSIEKEGYQKEIDIAKQAYDEQYRVYKDKIDNDKTLTKEERENLIKEFELLPQALKIQLDAIKQTFTEQAISAELEHLTASIELSNESQYQKQLESIKAQEEYWNKYLDNVKLYGNLSAEQYALVATEVGDTIALLNQSKLKVELDHGNEIIEYEYNHRNALIKQANLTTRREQIADIDSQIQYWLETLENTRKYGNLSADEFARYKQSIEDTLKDLQKQRSLVGIDVWDMLGISFGSEEVKEKVNEMFSTAFDYMNEWMDKRVEMAEVAIEAAQKEKDAAKSVCDYELQAMANGYANNVEYARKEYEKKLAIEKKAVAEKEKLQQIQEQIDTATQISSLVTATAELWAAHASIPVAGVALAGIATAAMWAAFMASKIQAANLAKSKTYGEGGMEYMSYGGSHASGHDIDFGRTRDGRQRRVERGEIVGIINKRSVAKYGVGEIGNLISSLNNGTFDKYSLAFQGGTTIQASADLSNIESGIGTLVNQGKTRVVYTENGRIEYNGNNKRIIRKS